MNCYDAYLHLEDLKQELSCIGYNIRFYDIREHYFDKTKDELNLMYDNKGKEIDNFVLHSTHILKQIT
jgi:hypothetical protein